MRSIEDKVCYNTGPVHEISSSTNSISFEFQKGANRTPNHHRIALGKPAPSKWDDAQKWLVGLSKGDSKNQSQSKPRNSNADDLRLITHASRKEHDYEEENAAEVVNKNVDCDNLASAVRSVCVRDMGTEMTPIASQEPSRTATPVRASTPVARSPIASGSSTPMRSQYEQTGPGSTDVRDSVNSDRATKLNPLETRAIAWDEAECARYMARYKQEEVKIQAWENHQKRKAENEMRKMEVKAERLKARAQEKTANKVAATRRIAEEKRTNAEAKLNEKAVKTSEKADYIRRTGHLPSSFSLKLPSLCW